MGYLNSSHIAHKKKQPKLTAFFHLFHPILICDFYFGIKGYFTSRIYLEKSLNFGYKEQLMEVFWPSIFQPWESRTKPWFLGELKASRSKRSTTFLLIKQQSPKREGEWLNKFSIFWERRSTGLRTSTLKCRGFLPMVSLKSLFLVWFFHKNVWN